MTETEETSSSTVTPVPEEPEAPKQGLEIVTRQDLLEFMQILDGIDPARMQALDKFINMDNDEERSYFPDRTTTIAIAQLLGYGNAFFENEESNPYTMVANVISRSFMGFKGFKSNQWADITRQTPDLSSLGSAPDEVKQGFMARFSGRGKE